ncbi:MAG: FAD-dependent oxidoreductase [Alphaproteobacteria bacterium]|nr:FAD-dependent oxidoreductase [Alphaproteobacteria bacterium]
MRTCDLAIVGAGPAGLAAATEAAAHGLEVVVVDENARPGGQYFRHPPAGFRHTAETPWDKDRRRGQALFPVLDHPRVSYLPDAVVWDMPEPGVLSVAAGPRSGRVQARAVILAPGAQDRPVPFPGWTLPGVISAGGVQNLLKGQRIVPGTRAVVVGNGPLLMLVGANLVRAGLKVAAIVEAAPIWRRLPAELARLAAAPEILAQALRYQAILARAGVPVLAGWTAVEASGSQAVDQAIIAPIDETGIVDHARRRRIDCDLLVTGFGISPAVELPRLLGARLKFDALRGGWTVERSADFETSVPNLFAAGDGAAIGGVELALAEGHLAAQAVARRLGRSQGDGPAASPWRTRWTRLDRFRRGLESLYRPPRSWRALITPETIVCRCEDVTRAEIERRRGEGATSAVQLKAATRMTMGRCQGRNCLPTLATLLADGTGVDPATIAMPRSRPPIRPIPIGDLAFEDLPPPDLPADPHLPRAKA